MTKFQTEWVEIAVRWSLTVETPFVVEVSDGQLVIPVLLRDFGAVRGMLLLTNFDLIAPYTDELFEQGYGFSCLSEPTAEPSERRDADSGLIEMLTDWRWSGEGSPPPWYRGDLE